MEISVHGKKVKVVLDFDDYSERKYRNDFENFLEYQTKREKFENAKDTDLKFLYVRELKNIPYIGLAKYIERKYPYELFQKLLSNFIIRIIQKVLEDFPAIITSDNLEVQVKISRITQREYYGGYDEKVSDAEHAYIEFSGLWLINYLLVPWIHFRRIDYQTIYNFTAHEMHHHVDHVHRAFIYEEKLEDKWKLKAKRISNYGALFLFSVLLELRREGFADFSKKRNFPRFDVDRGKIREFRTKLDKLVTIKGKEEAEEFFDSQLSTSSFMTYYCGSLMCYFIALFFSKEIGKEPAIVAGGRSYPLNMLSTVIGRNKQCTIINLPNQAFDKAYHLIYTMGPVEFLNMYNHACDNFGIPPKYRVLWWRLFVELKMKTTRIYEKERDAKLIRKHYKP